MKIEIGESMMLSWLKHCKNCQIVQTNWKPSYATWDLFNEEIIQSMTEDIQKLYLEQHQLDIFKDSSNTKQIIKQAEIDALGISLQQDRSYYVYGVDVAFHEGGLNYGTKDETIARLIKKYARTAMVFIGYFDIKEADIVFATPKIHNAVMNSLSDPIDTLSQYFSSHSYNFNFRLIANEDYANKILNPLTVLCSSVADTSELFMRSMQMYNLFDRPKPTSKPIPIKKQQIKPVTINNESEVPMNNTGYDEIKIGALVRSTFPQIINEGLLTEQLLTYLCSDTYSKQFFDLNFPMLLKLDQDVPYDQQGLDSRGRQRYYASGYRINGDDYLLSAQWFDRSKPLYIQWLHRIGFGN